MGPADGASALEGLRAGSVAPAGAALAPRGSLRQCLSPDPAPARHPHPTGAPPPGTDRLAPAPTGTPAPAAAALSIAQLGRDRQNGQNDSKHDRDFTRHDAALSWTLGRLSIFRPIGNFAVFDCMLPIGPSLRSLRIVAIAGLTLASLAGLLLLPQILQDQDYHQFADRRTIFGIPNFWNVTSNAPFLVVGAAGLRQFHRDATAVLFFLGVFLTAISSLYYHLEPRNDTLFWDRLPMTFSFAALLALIVGERVGEAAGAFLLWPALVVGAFSLLLWHWTDDLRLYFWVQFFPVFAAIFLFSLYPAKYTKTNYWIVAMALYTLAKIFEFTDEAIYSAGGIVSGHTLKHLAAAAACLAVLRYLRIRQLLVEAGSINTVTEQIR